MEKAFAAPADAVLANFKVDSSEGLADEQVIASRAKHGRNSKRPPPALQSLTLVANRGCSHP